MPGRANSSPHSSQLHLIVSQLRSHIGCFRALLKSCASLPLIWFARFLVPILNFINPADGRIDSGQSHVLHHTLWQFTSQGSNPDGRLGWLQGTIVIKYTSPLMFTTAFGGFCYHFNPQASSSHCFYGPDWAAPSYINISLPFPISSNNVGTVYQCHDRCVPLYSVSGHMLY
jgi:hypothetical protein